MQPLDCTASCHCTRTGCLNWKSVGLSPIATSHLGLTVGVLCASLQDDESEPDFSMMGSALLGGATLPPSKEEREQFIKGVEIRAKYVGAIEVPQPKGLPPSSPLLEIAVLIEGAV